MTHNQDFPYRKTVWLAILILTVVASLFLSSCGGLAAPKTYRVGILSGLDFFANTADGFKAEMTELGYVEGENIVYDFQKTNFDPAEEQRILEKFIADEVDLIFTFPTEVSLAAKAATDGTDIPVLFANANIEGVGLVESVRQPGGHVTGVRYPGPDLALKRFETLLELVPEAKRIWIPYQEGYPIVSEQLKALEPVAESLGITLVEVPATGPADIGANLQAQAAADGVGPDAILMIAEPLTVTPDAFSVLGQFAAENNVPMGGAMISIGDYGTIFGVSTDNVAVGKQAASLADKILKGTAAGTIPVVSAEGYLQLNYKLAEGLGLTVPEGMLVRATEIIR